jgi:uncharacterized GH25 family protein
MKRHIKTRVPYVTAAIILLSIAPGWCAGAAQGQQATFTGRILDAAGRPLGGISVRLYQQTYEFASSSYEAAKTAETTARTDGSFSFAAPPASDNYQYGYIVAEKQGLAIGFAGWDMRQDTRLDLMLGEAQPLGGVVVDEGGKSIADADVSIYELQIDKTFRQNSLGIYVASQLLRTRTDANGRFAFTNLPAGATAELLVRKPGKATVCTYAPRTFYGESLTYPVGRMDLRLVQPVEAKVEGAVVQKQTGQPVAEVTLVVTYGVNRPLDGFDPVRAKADGTFVVPALPAGAYVLQVAAARGKEVNWVGAAVPVTVKSGQTVTGLKVEVSKGGILEVAVTDAARHTPLEKASASVRPTQGSQVFSGISDAEGIIRLRLAPGTYQLLRASRQGYGYEQLTQTVTIEEGATKRVTVTLKETPKIRGVVRDPAGAPAAGVRIRIIPVGRDEITSDAQGKFELAWEQGSAGGRPENCCLMAQHEQRNLAAAIDLTEGMSTVDVKLEPAATIAGRVADPNGKGIAGARIIPMLRRTLVAWSMTREQILTDANGNFEIRAAPALYRYELYASANGYGSKRSEVVETEARKDRLEVGVLTLAPANLAISGRVVDLQDQPVARANISAFGFGEGQPERLSAQTDVEGKFTLKGVCPGQINLRVEANLGAKRLSAQVLTDGGSTDLKIVMREGRAPVQRLGGKNYSQVLAGGGRVIAGVAVDEKGTPVAGVPVQVCCRKAMREGRMTWMFRDFREFSTTTDAQGRFAIELKEDGEYNLLFSPTRLAALIVYDVPVGQKDLKVTLPEGGTVTGRLVRLEKGRKIAIPNAEVKVEQTDRISFSHLGFDQDRTMTTDAEGRFRFEHLCTQIRTDHNKPVFTPRTWKLSHGEVSQIVAFDGDEKVKEVDLIIKPDLAKAPSLVGQPLPSFEGIKFDWAAEQIKSKRVLVCFFDWEQRPSRNCVLQLAKQAPSLREKGIILAAVHVAKDSAGGLQKWAADNGIPFPVGAIQGDREEVSFAWSVKALPWLILTDGSHTVTAEGFTPNELDKKLAEEPHK